MRARFARITALLLLTAVIMCSFMLHTYALDDAYTLDDLGMSIKFSKEFYVVTADTAPDDPVFNKIDYDYEGLKQKFDNENIYLFAFDPDNAYRITLTVTEDDQSREIVNYSDLSEDERKALLEERKKIEGTTSAVEEKHSGNTFFDCEQQTAEDGRTVYVKLFTTVINGKNIYLQLKKYDDPIEQEEAKVLTNAAGSLKFDKIEHKTGAVFEWWRLLLWVGILAGFSVAITVIYKQYNASKKRRAEERRALSAGDSTPQPAHAKSEDITFEESLGYRDDEDFNVRADADEMAGYDIKIREENSDKGIEFFEDGGSSINDTPDYFETYFEEPVEKRTRFQKVTSAIVSYIKIAAKHTGYFFKNLFAKIFKKKK